MGEQSNLPPVRPSSRPDRQSPELLRRQDLQRKANGFHRLLFSFRLLGSFLLRFPIAPRGPGRGGAIKGQHGYSESKVKQASARKSAKPSAVRAAGAIDGRERV